MFSIVRLKKILFTIYCHFKDHTIFYLFKKKLAKKLILLNKY